MGEEGEGALEKRAFLEPLRAVPHNSPLKVRGARGVMKKE